MPRLHRSLITVAVLFLGAATVGALPQDHNDTLAELDAIWAEVSRTVAEGDFPAYSAVYHPDAVLVTGSSTVPITQALTDWEPGFAEGGARVDFRFTRRAHDDTTAHETGIFRFSSEDAVQYVHFEALMVKRDGRWLMLMEYQKGPATAADWEAAS